MITWALFLKIMNNLAKYLFKRLSILCLSVIVIFFSGCDKTEDAISFFTADHYSGVSPLTVTFTNQSRSAVSYLWDFGDGQQSTEKNPIHTFVFDPTQMVVDYTVTLTAYDIDGNERIYLQHINCYKNVHTDNLRITKFDQWVDSLVMVCFQGPYLSGISLGFIEGDEITTYNYGETKLGNSILPDNNTMYQIASITKTFTSISTLNWLQQKGISIDDPISTYLPSELTDNLELEGNQVTFHHLLNHTSGLPRIPSDMPDAWNIDCYSGYDSSKVFNYINNHSLLRKPGTVPKNSEQMFNYYGNLAYGLLGITLERNKNMSLQGVFDETLLGLAGMTNTTFNDIENFSNKAYPHKKDNFPVFWHAEGLAGCVGLNSNLNDMIKYGKFILSVDKNSEVGKALISSLTPQYSVQFYSGLDQACLPWYSLNSSGGKTIYSFLGQTYGFSTYFDFELENNKAFILLVNNWYEDSDIFSLFKNIENSFFD